MTNTEVPRQIILDTIDLANTAAEIYDGYEGRGMYGKTCFGITFEERDGSTSFFAALGIMLAQLEEREDESIPGYESYPTELARRAQSDSLGYSTIVYFPGYELLD